jgi:hypothetical protein
MLYLPNDSMAVNGGDRNLSGFVRVRDAFQCGEAQLDLAAHLSNFTVGRN